MGAWRGWRNSPSGGEAPNGEAEQDDGTDDDGRHHQQRAADTAAQERAPEADRLPVVPSDHVEAEQAVARRAPVPPFENAPDEEADDQGPHEQDHRQGQGPDAPAEARCGLLADHKKTVAGRTRPRARGAHLRRRGGPGRAAYETVAGSTPVPPASLLA